MKYRLDKAKKKISLDTIQGRVSFWAVNGNIIHYPSNIRPDIKSELERMGFNGEEKLEITNYLKTL